VGKEEEPDGIRVGNREETLRLQSMVFFAAVILSLSPEISRSSGLEELIMEAIAGNPRVLRAEMEWKAAERQITQARWWPDPQFSMTYERIPEGSYAPGAARTRMFALTQMIPFPGKLILRGRMAARQAMIAEERFEEEKQKVTAEVKKAYYRLFLVHKSISIENERRELLQRFAQIAETRYEVGQTAQHEVLKAHLELSYSADRLLNLNEEELPTTEAELNLLLDRPLDTRLEIPGDPEVHELKKTREEMQALALERREALRLLGHAVERSRMAHDLARMEYLPDLTVRLMQGEMETPQGTERNRGIMLSVNVPLWFWTKADGVSEKAAQRRSAEASYDATKKRVLLEVEAALARCNTSKRRIDLYETATIPLAEQALSTAIVAYETGEVDFLALMDSEYALKDAKLQYYRSIAEYATNVADLERIVGVTFFE
jgi:outer membrane protein TolC